MPSTCSQRLQSSEEESELEDEQPKVQFRPVFVPKRARATITEREQLAEDTEEALKKKEEEAERRKKESHDLVAESIKRELAESKSLSTLRIYIIFNALCRREGD